MCVIAAKPAGVAMPTTDTLIDMWYANPDGAGFMYADKGVVHIRKGFMELDDFLDAIDALSNKYELVKLPLVMHFRITTHGGTKPENCHPFPITDSLGVLKKLDSRAKVGVAHNGIIPITPRKDISDTMEYVLSQLAPLHRAVPEFYKNKDLMEMVSNAIDSKLAIMNDKGEIYTIGSFHEKDGIMYSNLNHEWSQRRDFRFKWSEAYGDWDGWDDGPITNAGEIKGSYKNHRVMWIDEDVAYVSGVKDPDIVYNMLAIDKDNVLYVYDDAIDALVAVPGATVYNFNGVPIRYDKKSKSVLTELVFEPARDRLPY